jgi:hypothetical protein
MTERNDDLTALTPGNDPGTGSDHAPAPADKNSAASQKPTVPQPSPEHRALVAFRGLPRDISEEQAQCLWLSLPPDTRGEYLRRLAEPNQRKTKATRR